MQRTETPASSEQDRFSAVPPSNNVHHRINVDPKLAIVSEISDYINDNNLRRLPRLDAFLLDRKRLVFSRKTTTSRSITTVDYAVFHT